MTTARRERTELADLMAELGPAAPTLCEGWTTRDLAAHLVLRERRPDAAPGIVLGGPLAGWTEKVQRGLVGQTWDRLVAQVRSGPPLYSPFRLVDRVANATEFLVHHEDVRRAQPGWEPRTLPAGVQDETWRQLRLVGRLGYRRSPVGVVLRRPGGQTVTVRRGPRPVTLTGDPLELLLHAFGRDEVRVDTDGAPADVEAVLGLSRGF